MTGLQGNRRIKMEILRSLFPLLLLGNCATALSPSGLENESDLNLDCVNYLNDTMLCQFVQFGQQNCTEHTLAFVLDNGGDLRESSGTCQQCNTGLCCCSVEMLLIPNEIHTATLWKGGERLESKIISVTESFKPKTPTIVSVTKSNGKFEVRWQTNMEGFSGTLSAEVTYYKKGDAEKKALKLSKQTRQGELWFYEIDGQHLDPSATYMVSVRTFTDWSQRASDSSKEVEFKTPASRNSVLLVVIISLSLIATVTSAAMFGCYVKLKTNWWDKYSKQRPVILTTCQHSNTPILKVEEVKTSTVCVEPLSPDDSKQGSMMTWTHSEGSGSLHSSGISTGSSHLSYAETEPPDVKAAVHDALQKVLFSISPPVTNPFNESKEVSGLFSAQSMYNPCGVRADGMSSESPGFINPSYARKIPIQQEPDWPFPAQQDISSNLQTVMSYQQCNADPQRLLGTEGCSLFPNPSGTETRASSELESRVGFSGAAKLTDPGENPPICLPADSHGFLEVEDDYQPIRRHAEEMELLFPDETCGDPTEKLGTYPEEPFSKIPGGCCSLLSPGFINGAKSPQYPPDFRIAFLPLMSADESSSVITDSGYQSV